MKRRRVIALCLAIGASSFLGALLGNAVAGDHVPAGYVRTRDLCAVLDAQGFDSTGPADRRLCPPGWDR